MKNDEKCRTWNGYGSLKVSDKIAIWYSAHELEFNRNYASILYRFWVIVSYFSKVGNLDIPALALMWWVILFKFCHDLWHQKLESLCYHVSLIAWFCLAVLIQYWSMIDTYLLPLQTYSYNRKTPTALLKWTTGLGRYQIFHLLLSACTFIACLNLNYQTGLQFVIFRYRDGPLGTTESETSVCLAWNLPKLTVNENVGTVTTLMTFSRVATEPWKSLKKIVHFCRTWKVFENRATIFKGS